MSARVPTVSSDYKSVGTSLGMAGVCPPKDAEIQIPGRHLVSNCLQDGYTDSRCIGTAWAIFMAPHISIFHSPLKLPSPKEDPSVFISKCLVSTKSQFILALHLQICYSTPHKTPFFLCSFFSLG